MGAQLFRKCRSHLKIPATRRVTRGKIHIENPQTLESPFKIYSPERPDAPDFWILEKYTPKNHPKLNTKITSRPRIFFTRKTTNNCNSVQDVYKMLGQTSRVSSSYKQSGNERSFSLIATLRSTINSWIMQYFTHNWHNTFTLHVSSLIGVQFLLCIKSKFTQKNAQNVLHLNLCMHGHSCKVSGAVTNGFTGLKCALVTCLFILNSSWIH